MAINELLDYAGADGLLSIDIVFNFTLGQHASEIKDLSRYKGATGAQYAWSDAFARLAIGMLNHKTQDAYA